MPIPELVALEEHAGRLAERIKRELKRKS